MSRYPLADLAAACGLSEHALCVRLGLSGKTEQRAIREGLSELTADRYAVRMGLAPANVWPRLLDAAVEDEQERRREQWRRSARKRWANDPEHRARRAEYMRQYRADAKKVLAAQKRKWQDENRELVRARNREAMRRLRARRAAESQDVAA